MFKIWKFDKNYTFKQQLKYSQKISTKAAKLHCRRKWCIKWSDWHHGQWYRVKNTNQWMSSMKLENNRKNNANLCLYNTRWHFWKKIYIYLTVYMYIQTDKDKPTQHSCIITKFILIYSMLWSWYNNLQKYSTT